MARHKKKKFAELATLANFYKLPDYIKGKWNAECFKNDRPIVLELGCGKGEYTNKLGAEFPDKNFIGIDLKGARLWRGAKNAIASKLKNVAFLQINIDNIVDYFEHEEVAEIWIPFPDPYPKPSKWKKRLVSSYYLNKYREILKSNGILHFKTDNSGLFEFCRETLEMEKHRILQIADNLYGSENLDKFNGIPTYFWEIFRGKGEKSKHF
ncbi:MAG: tRNA (guanosine(46)-N7)-methyltransferase TrmB [Bacteroidetes bacterium]|nr:tRNA (guanosine(46)-N7)-methyltransferase TrmB [Bacteroidota bacterium]